ncbi:hypothetical protein BJX76DRAFT_330738 [Aspergillus varians]
MIVSPLLPNNNVNNNNNFVSLGFPRLSRSELGRDCRTADGWAQNGLRRQSTASLWVFFNPLSLARLFENAVHRGELDGKRKRSSWTALPPEFRPQGRQATREPRVHRRSGVRSQERLLVTEPPPDVTFFVPVLVVSRVMDTTVAVSWSSPRQTKLWVVVGADLVALKYDQNFSFTTGGNRPEFRLADTSSVMPVTISYNPLPWVLAWRSSERPLILNPDSFPLDQFYSGLGLHLATL